MLCATCRTGTRRGCACSLRRCRLAPAPPHRAVRGSGHPGAAGSPHIAPTTWAPGGVVRGLAGDIAEAGRALGRFDARAWIGELYAPAAVVVTTRDRVVPPGFQRDLARRLGAAVVESKGDHLDTNRPEFTRALLGALQATSIPPSTGSMTPVTYDARRWPGTPARRRAPRLARRGRWGRRSDLALEVAVGYCSVISDGKKPGASALTRMPLRPVHCCGEVAREPDDRRLARRVRRLWQPARGRAEHAADVDDARAGLHHPRARLRHPVRAVEVYVDHVPELLRVSRVAGTAVPTPALLTSTRRGRRADGLRDHPLAVLGLGDVGGSARSGARAPRPRAGLPRAGRCGARRSRRPRRLPPSRPRMRRRARTMRR